MKVLVTSSTGLTGKAIVKALADKGAYVRAMVHSETHANDMLSLGAKETVVASIENETDMAAAVSDMDTVIYICPTAHPEEGRIGCMAADIAANKGIKRFVYQSVHNSIEPQLSHHRQKLMVEQHLLESELNYSILRPAAFMQNILAASGLIREKHEFAQRFYTSPESKNLINLIDVEDYAAIAAEVAMGNLYDYGTYDLCGPDNLSAQDMLTAINEVTGHTVTLRYTTDEEFIAMAKQRNIPENMLNTLLAMFRAYNQFGFKGNSFTTECLLHRKPNDFKNFLIKNL